MRPTNATVSPWARSALEAAGLSERGIRALAPAGWHLTGHATTARGPWTFALVSQADGTPVVRQAIAYRVADVREAIAGLLASVTPDLEAQLAASLAVLEGK